MAGTVAIGIQQFNEIRKKGYFYIDKTAFIREWWEKGDSVTLITRPRRFGKTLTMSMVEQFFSVKYAGQQNLFEGLAICDHLTRQFILRSKALLGSFDKRYTYDEQIDM